MNKYIIILISSFIINVIEMFCIHKIVNEKMNLKSKKTYFIYLLMVLLIFLNYIFSNNLYKVFITLLISLIEIKLLFNKSLKENIVIAVLMELTTILAEFIFALVISLINNINPNSLAQTYQGTIVTNIFISFIIFLLSNILFLNKIYNKIINLIGNISIKKVVIFLSIIIVCGSTLFYLSYYNKNNIFSLIVNFIIITIYFLIVILLMKKENKYNRIRLKYLVTIQDLNEYESIINQYRIINHENQNQLQAIKGMTKNKKLIDYINEIIKSKNSENKSLINQALLIPTGGLRGLIYSKLILMKEKSIKYSINIDKKINSKLMKNISSNEMIDICQIIGVFIDNAIEAVEKLKERVVIINVFRDENINIEIQNTYDNSIELNKIDKIGYSTKGKNHGYGLALVNRILKNNKNFSNEREVSKNLFKQKLIIKI